MYGRYLAVLIMAICLSGAAAGVARAQSSDVTAALTEASKLMQKGGYVKAIEVIDGALRSGKVPSELAAKALLMRAESNEKLGRTAFALADYNSSLWMQGLSAPDRKRAEDGHGRVMKGLGVAAPQDKAEVKSSPAVTGSTSTKPEGKAWNADVQQAPGEERKSGGGISGFFGNLFGSSSSSQRVPQEQAGPPATVAVIAQVPEGKAPPPQKAAPKKAVAAAAAPAPAASKAPESGNFAIQLAAVAEEDKAIAEADRLAKKFGPDLGGRTPSLMIVPTSDGGTLYKIVAAPFETRGEGLATCELLKSKGGSCMVITKK